LTITTIEPFYVVDTHAIIWYLMADKKLGSKAAVIFEAATRGETQLVLPSIVIAEMYYSNVKNKFFPDFSETHKELKEKPYIQFVDFTADDVLDFDQDSAVPEMHDRIITGLARRINAPLLTHDSVITAAGLVRIVW
jgi:PIN domain nuclease of toxin-antitoxin system